MSDKFYGYSIELDIVEGALRAAIDLGGYLQDIAGTVPEADAALNTCIRALMDRKRTLRDQMDNDKHDSAVDTKDMSTLLEVAKLLGQIGTAGAAMYVGAGAARETYDALKAKCREMMDKLDDAQRQLDDIDPRDLDAEMRSAPNLNETKSFGDIINWLYAGGVAFVLGTTAWDNRDRIMGMLENAIDAVRDSITYLRFGSTLADLQKVIDTLEAAGIQVPYKVQAIVDNPDNGDVSTYASVNIEYARGWLETALRLLQEAQSRAETMPEERSDSRPLGVKSGGAYHLYR